VGLPGTKPTEDRSQVRRRNAPEPGTEWVEVPNVEHDGPPLGHRPESSSLAGDRPLGADPERWPQETLDWWEDVRTMPHAARWSRAEWRTARTAAEAHARFVEGWKGCASGSELRQREKQLGMTADARRDLRIRYVEPPRDDAELPANVTRVDFGAL
jgi:hypothetical protein